jgi:phosphoribosylformylglycinamidine synthase subunit PurQ / glutaminase
MVKDADQATLDKLEADGQVIYRYCDAQGNVTAEANPNGSTNNIAGIRNAAGNVFGMMPHPERATASILGNTDGLKVFAQLFQVVPEPVAAF